MTRAGRALDGLGRLLDRVLPTGRPEGEPYRAPRLVALWLLTRAFALLTIVVFPSVVADLGYYVRAINGGMDGMPAGLREYPLPAAWLLELPDLVADGDVVIYPLTLMLCLVAIDALFTAFLHRACPPRTVTLWLAAGVLVGPLLYTRFDIVTGTAVAVALVVLQRRPRVAAALVAGAAMLKLWPAVLLPAMASPRAGRARFAATAAALLVLVALAVLLVADLDRALSPLRYQADRGLQVESLAALPLMAAWAVVHAPWSVFQSDFLAVEIHGPGADALMVLSSLATLAALALVAVIAARLWRCDGGARGRAVAWAVLSATTTLVLANKVFSPQYLIWLVPTAIAVVALDRGRTALRCALALLVAGAISQVLYPALYGTIAEAGTFNLVGIALLVARLVPIVAVAVVATRQAWRLSARAPEPVAA